MKTLTKQELLRMYDYVGEFSEGLARASEGIGRALHIRPDGTPAYEERFDWTESFFGGLARVGLKGEVFNISPDGKCVGYRYRG